MVSAMLFFAGIGPLATAVYSSFFIGISSVPPWLLNCFYVWELFFPALLYFSAIFPEPLPIYDKYKKLLQLAFIPHVMHLLMVVLLANPDKVLEVLNFDSTIPVLGAILGFILGILKIVISFVSFLLLFHNRFFSLINFIYVISAIALLYMGFIKIENIRLKQQVKVIIYGISIAVGLYTLGYIIPTIFAFEMLKSLRNVMVIIGLIIGPGSIAWAIVRYQFLDVGLIARRSLVYTISTAIVVGGYLLVILQAGSLIQSMTGRDSEIINVLIIIVLLLFFQPIYTQVDDFVKRIFIRSRGDYSKLIESFSHEILTIFQEDRLVVTIAETLKREMFVEEVVLCFEVGDRLFKTATEDPEEHPTEMDEPLYDYLLARSSPVYADEISSKLNTGCFETKIKGNGVEVLVPLSRKKKLVGVLMLSSKVAGFRYNSEDMSFLKILGNQIMVALENAELYKESLEKQRLEEELSVAKNIQMGLLPKALPNMKNFEFSAYIEPSRQVGGDYYDFIPIEDGRFGIVIADTSGKGVPAALLTARMQVMIQSEVRFGRDVNETMKSVNYFLAKSTSADKFATCFYAEINDDQRKFRYCNAGHNYPILIHKDGRFENLETGGLLLGAFSDAKYEFGEVELAPGDLLIMYTDGLSEAMDNSDQEYGESRIVDNSLKIRSQSADVICSMLVKSVKQFAAGISDFDDMTVVIVKSRDNESE
jgi:sigma-B regulation protein RsbU (phosphoserine phosphatase)